MEDDVEPMDRMDYGEDAGFGSTEVIDDEGMKSALEMFQKVSEIRQSLTLSSLLRSPTPSQSLTRLACR